MWSEEMIVLETLEQVGLHETGCEPVLKNREAD